MWIILQLSNNRLVQYVLIKIGRKPKIDMSAPVRDGCGWLAENITQYDVPKSPFARFRHLQYTLPAVLYSIIFLNSILVHLARCGEWEDSIVSLDWNLPVPVMGLWYMHLSAIYPQCWWRMPVRLTGTIIGKVQDILHLARKLEERQFGVGQGFVF